MFIPNVVPRNHDDGETVGTPIKQWSNVYTKDVTVNDISLLNKIFNFDSTLEEHAGSISALNDNKLDKSVYDEKMANLDEAVATLSSGKVDYDDILTYEEISASTMLTDKDVAGAKAIKDLFMVKDVSVSVSIAANSDSTVTLPNSAKLDGYRVSAVTPSSTGNASLYMRAFNNYNISVHNMGNSQVNATVILRLLYTKL